MKKTKINVKNSSFALDLLGTCMRMFITLMLVTLFCVRVARVDGHSMETTLADNDLIVLTDLVDYTPEDGDIVVIARGAQLDTLLVKRVIATAGQRLYIDYADNAVYVDGHKLDEPYITGRTIRGDIPESELNRIIPAGKVFVMGDNREHSTDSRFYAVDLINESDIIGKVQADILPHGFDEAAGRLELSRFGTVYGD